MHPSGDVSSGCRPRPHSAADPKLTPRDTPVIAKLAPSSSWYKWRLLRLSNPDGHSLLTLLASTNHTTQRPLTPIP